MNRNIFYDLQNWEKSTIRIKMTTGSENVCTGFNESINLHEFVVFYKLGKKIVSVNRSGQV